MRWTRFCSLQKKGDHDRCEVTSRQEDGTMITGPRIALSVLLAALASCGEGSGAGTEPLGTGAGGTNGASTGGSTTGSSGSSQTTAGGTQSGSGSSGHAGSDGTSGDTDASGRGGGSGGAAGGGSDDAASGSSGGAADGGSILFDGGVNMIPAGYTGTPFAQNVIPGFIYTANYDRGGPGVAYCHSAMATTPAACATGIHLTDWCCSDTNPQMTGARCDDRNQATGPCPIYRADSDNAGLSHMNLGEVDTYAADGPTWVAGLNGPTLTGPMVTVGTPVPQHADTTTQDDTYLSYTNTGEWQKYTVKVLSAGTYSIGALMGTPPNTKATFDFGGGITSGAITLPASPVTAACRCIEAYHAWYNSSNFSAVTFPAAGTYLMTLTLNAGTYNPLYFTFTRM
jgi:hypothetical protein